MSLRSVFLKTLREQWVATVAWGAGLGLVGVSTGVGWFRAYPDESSRRSIEQQVETGLSAAKVFFGEPHNLLTLGGVIEWRALGAAPLLLGLFMVIATTGVTRGAEESGRLEVVAATPVTRLRLLFQQCAALVVALLAASAIGGASLLLAGPLAGEDVLQAPRVAGTMLNIALVALVFGGVALVAAQLTTSRRSAGVAAAGLMFAAHFWHGLGLLVSGIGNLGAISPLYLYARSHPLADGHMDWAAVGAQGWLAIALGAVALTLAARRDLFGVWRPSWLASRRREERLRAAPAQPAPRGFLLRNAFARGVVGSMGTAAVWAIGLAAFAALATSLIPSVLKTLIEERQSGLAKQLADAGLLSERGLISAVLFQFLPLFLSLTAITLASSWARDETSGQLEMELACPPSRAKVFLQRLASVSALLLLVLAACWGAVSVAAQLRGVEIPAAAITEGAVSLLVLAVTVAAICFAVAAWKPGALLPAAGGFVAVSYFLDLLLPLFDLPGAVGDVSIFHLYGQPVTDGIRWPGIAALAAITAILAAGGALRFQSRDIARR